MTEKNVGDSRKLNIVDIFVLIQKQMKRSFVDDKIFSFDI